MKNWCLEVWGDFACFTRPEMKVERMSYDVITPSAARAIFESILWKPAIRWNITKIEVLRPIRWISVRRNEVNKKITSPSPKQMTNNHLLGMYIEDERQQRAGLLLKDVHYRIHAYFDFLANEGTINPSNSEIWSGEEEKVRFESAQESPAKYAAMFERRASKGQCFNQPYLGCREFSCSFKLVKQTSDLLQPISDSRDLGFMLYDINFTDKKNPIPQFFRAIMTNGTINTDKREIEVIE